MGFRLIVHSTMSNRNRRLDRAVDDEQEFYHNPGGKVHAVVKRRKYMFLLTDCGQKFFPIDLDNVECGAEGAPDSERDKCSICKWRNFL